MRAKSNESPSGSASGAERPKVVYTQAPLQLATVLGEHDGRWRIELGGIEREVDAAAEVDPALLRDVVSRGGRALLEILPDGTARIAGALQTRRSLEIDPEGVVDAALTSLRIRVKREVQLTSERAFVWINGDDVEIYGKQVLTRAREVAKILGRLISLN